MVFIETGLFTKLLSNYLSDDEYQGLQAYLIRKPDAGKIVKGSGGIRKVRWSRDGGGKSGGVRIIYYWEKAESEFWMLTIYAESETATISGPDLKRIWEAVTRAKS